MENQHRKITGYRELDQEQIDLMNKIKALGPKIEEVLSEVHKYIGGQFIEIQGEETPENEIKRQHRANAEPGRWAAMAKTDLQTGLMYLTRAVAQPEFF